LQAATEAMLPLIERSVLEHDRLLAMAGLEALVKADGWIEIFRDPVALATASTQAKALERFGINYRLLDGDALRAQQPGLTDQARGGIHWTDPKTVQDPGALVKGYADLFDKMGGRLVLGDALSLTEHQGGWHVSTQAGSLSARQVVITLGADAGPVYEKLGYRIPMAIKRGYHLHFKGHDDVPLKYSLCDSSAGFVIAPMNAGIRLTTGIEFATPHAPMRDIQLRRAEKIARRLFALGERTSAAPWMGRRPCLPDMCPVIGPAPSHRGLWFNFGHAHHGLTLGPVSGRLIAQLITGEVPFTNPKPYRVERFS
jgi:D-amino-acid dehydrogenase